MTKNVLVIGASELVSNYNPSIALWGSRKHLGVSNILKNKHLVFAVVFVAVVFVVIVFVAVVFVAVVFVAVVFVAVVFVAVVFVAVVFVAVAWSLGALRGPLGPPKGPFWGQNEPLWEPWGPRRGHILGPSVW